MKKCIFISFIVIFTFANTSIAEYYENNVSTKFLDVTIDKLIVNWFTTLLNDSSYSGIVISDLNAGTTIAQWQLVYIDATTGEYQIADADGTGTYPAVGVAVESGTDGNSLKILKSGIGRDDTWSWTVNGAVYLSTTTGELTQIAPSTTDDCYQPVGRAVSATIVLFDINSITGWGIVP